MQKSLSISIILALIFTLMFVTSCQKEETEVDKVVKTSSISENLINQDSIFLAGLESYLGSRSGAKYNYYARNSHTSTNYLLGQEPNFVATEIAFNTDSVNQIIHKRHDPEIANIGGVLCGVWSITHQFKDGSEETDIYFSRDTSINYFVINEFTANNAKFTHNYMRVEREPVALMDYYDFDFKKYKKKAMYTIKSKSNAYRDRLPSRLSNSNIFRFTHI